MKNGGAEHARRITLYIISAAIQSVFYGYIGAGSAIYVTQLTHHVRIHIYELRDLYCSWSGTTDLLCDDIIYIYIYTHKNRKSTHKSTYIEHIFTVMQNVSYVNPEKRERVCRTICVYLYLHRTS